MYIVIYTIPLVLIILFASIYLHKRRSFIKEELEDVVEKCTEIEKKCKEGYAVFYPDEDEKYLYDILVKRKIMINNPMGDGYLFYQAEEKLWSGVPRDFASVPKDRYQDDDGVVSYEKKEGKLIPRLTEEDIENEKSKSIH